MLWNIQMPDDRCAGGETMRCHPDVELEPVGPTAREMHTGTSSVQEFFFRRRRNELFELRNRGTLLRGRYVQLISDPMVC